MFRVPLYRMPTMRETLIHKGSWEQYVKYRNYNVEMLSQEYSKAKYGDKVDWGKEIDEILKNYQDVTVHCSC